MPRFRNSAQHSTKPEPASGAISEDAARSIAAEAMRPAHFFLAPPLDLVEEHRATEEISWEVFNGRLLDPRHTRCRQTFESWNLYLSSVTGRSEEPILSLKLDARAGLLHVTRAILSYVWEGYDAGDNVILSRETCRWARELTGTVSLAQFTTEESLRDEIIGGLFQAVVGSSRLPLISTESPLPTFSLGQMAYFFRPGLDPDELTGGPMRTWRSLLDKTATVDLALLERAKLLETLLHAVPHDAIEEAADLFNRWPHARAPIELFRVLFNEASLSPYTDLVDKSLSFLEVLESGGRLSADERIDFLGHLLRQLGRHLTAYDLVTFHHRGANYPDALVLDAVLKSYLRLAEQHPTWFLAAGADSAVEEKTKRMRRRALRQGCLIRRRYEGHLVPDAPTSQGENARVLPSPHVRVPEDQVLNPHRRNKKLYDADPLGTYLGTSVQAILRQGAADLSHPAEMRELGLGIFLDRPLGAAKGPLEPDNTALFSYLAFSRSIARRRLQFLAETLSLIPDKKEYDALLYNLEHELKWNGLTVDAIDASSRPGGVSLGDARKAADDFLFLRTTSQTSEEFFQAHGLDSVLKRELLEDLRASALIVRVVSDLNPWHWVLAVYDGAMRRRLELDFDMRLDYVSRGGKEYPAGPIRVLRVWEQPAGQESGVRSQESDI